MSPWTTMIAAAVGGLVDGLLDHLEPPKWVP